MITVMKRVLILAIASLLSGLSLLAAGALFVSPFASAWPDGLESVASTLGFDQKALELSPARSPLADYHFPGVGSAAGATVMAGAVGVVVAFLLSYILARVLVPAPPRSE